MGDMFIYKVNESNSPYNELHPLVSSFSKLSAIDMFFSSNDFKIMISSPHIKLMVYPPDLNYIPKRNDFNEL